MGALLLDDKVRAGGKLFDEGHFFEAHEAWEGHWVVEEDAQHRVLLQGLIQIAAAFHKLIDRNAPEPAASLFAKGLAKLDACPGRIDGVDISSFREAVRVCAMKAKAGGFDRAKVPKFRYDRS